MLLHAEIFLQPVNIVIAIGDVLVFNDTRVIPAALEGHRVRGAARARILANLHKRVDHSRWRAFVRPARKLEVGDRIRFGEGRLTAPPDNGTDGDVRGTRSRVQHRRGDDRRGLWARADL